VRVIFFFSFFSFTHTHTHSHTGWQIFIMIHMYNSSYPCADLERKLEAERRRLSGETSVRASGGSMYSRGDMSRAELIEEGWPWEDDSDSTMMIILIASGAVISLLIVGAVLWYVMRSSKRVKSDGSSGLEMK